MIHTDRLTLIPLTLQQLESGLASVQLLSAEVGFPLVSDLFTSRAEHALKIKVETMRAAPVAQHAWFTYWLVLIDCEGIGAGLIGFKGFPDENGTVEIGYSINTIFQSHGYMSEAVKALVEWAFSHAQCKKVTAIVGSADNIASRKVLVKSDFSEVGTSTEGIRYELAKT